MMMNHTGPLVVADTDTDLDSCRKFEAGQPLSSCAVIKYPIRPSPTLFAMLKSYDQTISLALVVVDAVIPDCWTPCAVVEGIVP